MRLYNSAVLIGNSVDRKTFWGAIQNESIFRTCAVF
jgi:hypothetical protein